MGDAHRATERADVLGLSFKGKLLLLTFSTTVSLLLAELVLRVAGPPSPYGPDPILGAKAAVGPDRDARGFRNDSIPPRADIVALGDSQTEGYNTATREEAWPKVLGRMSSLTVYNMGICGYGPVQHAHLLDEALDFHPKIVLVGFYLGNDITDAFTMAYQFDHWRALRDPEYEAADAKEQSLASADKNLDMELMLSTGLEPGTLRFQLYKIRLGIRDHSRVVALLASGSRKLREKLHLTPSDAGKAEAMDGLAARRSDAAYVYKGPAPPTVLSPLYRKATVDLSQPTTREGWRITRILYEEMRDKAASRGAHLVIVAIPTKEMVYLDHMERNGERTPERFLDYAAKERELADALANFCRDARLPCFFALPALSRALDRGIPVYPDSNDGHPLPSGYRVMAGQIFDDLERSGLLPL